MATFRWPITVALLGQAGVPNPPTNLRIIKDIGSCQSGEVGVPPNCFPAPPAPVRAGQQRRVAYSEEFNGTALVLTKLTPCFDWNFGACTASFNTVRSGTCRHRCK